MNNPSKPIESLHPADLATLAQLIENRRCALVLGPHATTDIAGQPLWHLLGRQIAEAVSQKTGSPLPEPDNLALAGTAFLQTPGTPRLSLELLVRDFYKSHTEPNELLHEVARLSFPLVCTVSPEGLLRRAFLKTQRNFREGVYRFAKTQVDDFDKTPAETTYLYQLFGNLDERGQCDSMVLCLDDQLKYIDSVQGVGRETRLPASLRSAMQDYEAFLFLGFDYENWYLKVLFHILQISASEKTKLIFGLPDGLSRDISAGSEAFFRQQYRFRFFKDEPLDLLRRLRQQIEFTENSTADPTDQQPARTLLFLHATDDQALVERLDRHLAQVKKRHRLVSKSIHDFVGDDIETVQNQRIDSAAVIVPVLSPDFFADDILSEKLTVRAFSRQSDSVCVVSVFAREMGGGVSDFFKNKTVLPAHTVPLTWMDENTGLAKIAENLEKFIAVLQ